MSRLNVQITLGATDTGSVGDILTQRSGLSRSRINDAMLKGAVWLQESGSDKQKRLRRYTYEAREGDQVTLNYDSQLLAREPVVPSLLADRQRYTVWYKPAGLMSQGNEFGDHCSLLRIVEKHYKPFRKAYLVHRLDTDAHGLVIIAHDKAAAAKLSHLFRHNEVERIYRVLVHGRPEAGLEQGIIDEPLDKKPARTRWELISYRKDNDQTELRVHLETDRRHQIRRHFQMTATPIVGDRHYGKGNEDKVPLQLAAVGLRFICPVEHQAVEFNLPENLQ